MTAQPAKKLLVLPGDGIGPEVMREVGRIITWLEEKRGLSFEITEDLVGGASLAEYGEPIRDEVIEKARAADAVLFGSVGDPRWNHVGFEKRPELAILKLRQELALFANLRPAKVFDALVDASTLKPDVVRGLDIMIVRETVGVFTSVTRAGLKPCLMAASVGSIRKFIPHQKLSASPV